MSGDAQVTVCQKKYKMEALAAVLAAEGTTLEERLRRTLTELYVELVPHETQRAIRARINGDG